jgi:hypothetical protein
MRLTAGRLRGTEALACPRCWSRPALNDRRYSRDQPRGSGAGSSPAGQTSASILKSGSPETARSGLVTARNPLHTLGRGSRRRRPIAEERHGARNSYDVDRVAHRPRRWAARVGVARSHPIRRRPGRRGSGGPGGRGWQAWVDGRQLIPLAAAASLIPADGLAAWAAPDATQPPVVQAAAGLQVRVLERSGDWAQVEFTNGWKAWVDGRALVPATGTLAEQGAASPTIGQWIRKTIRAPLRITPLPAIGCALVLLGSFLPWGSGFGVSVTAWDLSGWGLLTRQPTTFNVRAGVFLLVTLVGCIPYLTRRPLPRLVNPILAGIPTSLTIGGLLLARQVPGVSIGIGGIITFIGGLVLAAESVVTVRQRS